MNRRCMHGFPGSAIAALAIVMVACGGDGGGPPDIPTVVDLGWMDLQAEATEDPGVVQELPPPECAQDGECDDGNDCTTDRCLDHRCVREAVACDDPPANRCKDRDRLIVSAAQGTCQPNQGCTYASELIVCENGCVQAACVMPPATYGLEFTAGGASGTFLGGQGSAFAVLGTWAGARECTGGSLRFEPGATR